MAEWNLYGSERREILRKVLNQNSFLHASTVSKDFREDI